MKNDVLQTIIVLQRSGMQEVGLQWKNPDFLLRNPDFLLRNPDFLFKNVDFIIIKKTTEGQQNVSKQWWILYQKQGILHLKWWILQAGDNPALPRPTCVCPWEIYQSPACIYTSAALRGSSSSACIYAAVSLSLPPLARRLLCGPRLFGRFWIQDSSFLNRNWI